MSNVVLFSAIGIYLFIVILLGVMGMNKRKRGDVSDFYRGGRSFGSFVVVMTFWASLFSAFTFIGLPGFFYTHGIGTFAFLVFADMLLIIPIFLYGRKIWKISLEHDSISPVEVLVKRYNSKIVTLLTVLVTSGFVVAFLAVQIVGIGKLINSMSGGAVSYLAASAFMVLIIYIYSEMGGMRTIAWTDALQGSLMLILFFVIAFSFLNIGWDGSLTNMFQDLVTNGNGDLLSLPGPVGLFTYQMLVSFFFIFMFGGISYPYISQRLFIFKDEKVIKKLLIFFPILVFLIIIPATIIGLGAASMFPNLASGDLALPEVLKLFTNPLISALAVIGILAGAMSSADSQLLSVGSILSRDVYKKFFNPNASSNNELKWSRIFILLAAALAFLISINPPQLIVSLGVLASSGFVQLVPTYIGGLTWKKATREGALVSILVGVVSLFAFQYWVTPWFGFHPGFIGLILGTISYIIVSLLTYRK